ncbi:charged multivesicular body protein 2b-like [Phlebotomus papatasi]|uniref:charged multivesicular body protein 2b-like n=1 Tax=Phlebotomus papatasi TaxID=29031 RepID=UPI002483D3F3|nr:charged multivesicular body protein 2b-like [Phlebotomus papatasi]
MEEKKLQIEIKKNFEAGYKEVCSLLTKQLVELRKQKNRTYAANRKIMSVSLKNKIFGAHTSLSRDMATAVKTMGEMNTMMGQEKITGNIRAFQKAYLKMDMIDELTSAASNDAV